MNATTAEITDQATATAALNKARDELQTAVDEAKATTAALRDAIVRIRPSGILTVGEMAEAVSRERNYVDTVWSAFGCTTKGKQTRVSREADDDARAQAVQRLYEAARTQRNDASAANVARAERDRTVAMVYASKIMGPSAIAMAVGIDRNHVLRLARRAGLTPAWRAEGTVRNQHTTKG